MGAWGAALYSGDFAADLRGTVKAVARLPFEPDRLVEILCESEPGAANDPADEDHTTFWLVVADQFAKRGIVCASVRDRALAIIDEERDLAMLAKLGMDAPGLAKRRKQLAELRARLTAPFAAKSRTVLKQPQPYVFSVGDLVIYPASGGKCINPYFPSKEKIPDWQQDGWGAALIVASGRAFDFLAWYRPLVLGLALPAKPDLAGLRAPARWLLRRPGTCSAAHVRKMEMATLATLPLDAEKLARHFPAMRPGTAYAVDDISIANVLSADGPADLMAKPQPPLWKRQLYPPLASLGEILAG